MDSSLDNRVKPLSWALRWFSSRLSFAAKNQKSDRGLAFSVSGMLETSRRLDRYMYKINMVAAATSIIQVRVGALRLLGEPARALQHRSPPARQTALPQGKGGLLAQKIAALSVLAATSAIGGMECRRSDLCPVAPPSLSPCGSRYGKGGALQP